MAGYPPRLSVDDRFREVLRSLPPVATVVLLDVTLDARTECGGLAAATSARLIADHIGVDAATAGRALRNLRDAGLLALTTSTQDARFALSSYRLTGPIRGLIVAAPCVGPTRAVKPRAAADALTLELDL